jgi:hypothetical protein
MMTVDAALAQDVGRLMQDFGAALTLARPSVGTYNPATGAMPASTSTNFTVQGVFVNYEDRNVDGTVVRAGDRRLLVSAQGSTTIPQIGDRVSGLQVIDVRTVAPRGVTIAWACQMRK